MALMARNRGCRFIQEFIRRKEEGFKSRHHLPDGMRLRLPRNRLEIRGEIDDEGSTVVLISAYLLCGLNFPMDEIVAEFLHTHHFSPAQLSINTFRTLLAVKKLSDNLNVGLELKDIMGCYAVVRSELINLAALYGLNLVTGLPKSNRLYNADFMVVTGNWGPVREDLFVRHRPSRLAHYPDFPPADPQKVLTIMKYWGDGVEDDPDSRSCHRVLGCSYPPGIKATSTEVVKWDLKEVEFALGEMDVYLGQCAKNREKNPLCGSDEVAEETAGAGLLEPFCPADERVEDSPPRKLRRLRRGTELQRKPRGNPVLVCVPGCATPDEENRAPVGANRTQPEEGGAPTEEASAEVDRTPIVQGSPFSEGFGDRNVGGGCLGGAVGRPAEDPFRQLAGGSSSQIPFVRDPGGGGFGVEYFGFGCESFGLSGFTYRAVDNLYSVPPAATLGVREGLLGFSGDLLRDFPEVRNATIDDLLRSAGTQVIPLVPEGGDHHSGVPNLDHLPLFCDPGAIPAVFGRDLEAANGTSAPRVEVPAQRENPPISGGSDRSSRILRGAQLKSQLLSQWVEFSKSFDISLKERSEDLEVIAGLHGRVCDLESSLGDAQSEVAGHRLACEAEKVARAAEKASFEKERAAFEEEKRQMSLVLSEATSDKDRAIRDREQVEKERNLAVEARDEADRVNNQRADRMAREIVLLQTSIQDACAEGERRGMVRWAHEMVQRINKAYMDGYADGLNTVGVDHQDPMWTMLSFPFRERAPQLNPGWGRTAGSRDRPAALSSIVVAPVATLDHRQAC